MLDLCAGTGICGIEAISRGAAYVEFVEQNYQAVRHILQTLETFSCRQRAKVDCADAAKWLSKTNRAGDRPAWKIVLFDPPYQDRKLQFQCLYALSQHSRVNAKTLVCFESPTEMDDLPAQDIWQIERTLKFSSTSIRMLRLAQ